MTESEAIKEIKKLYPKKCKMVDGRLKGGFDDHESKGGVAIDMAIQALEKQIPKKPMISYDERVKENWCSCGVCAFGLCWKRTIHYKYCPDCGQKLDWSDEE